MKVLIIGSGGREHALAWKIAQSPKLTNLYCAPGNPGTAALGENVPIDVTDIQGLVQFAKKEDIALTIVGPELPLTLGITDAFSEAELPIFGPNKELAQIEGSKTFAKEIMQRAGVPTAAYQEFSDAAPALDYLATQKAPIVVKADGLAAGKGVFVCETIEQAQEGVREAFDSLGSQKIIIEQFLTGKEASYIVATNGSVTVPFCASHDYKRIGEGDTGPNTGGMGTVSPTPHLTTEQETKVFHEVIEPVVRELSSAGAKPYVGFLYAGLMISEDDDISVLEFNARMGDPETQVILPRMEGDLLELLMALYNNTPTPPLTWSDKSAIAVVAASAGYPASSSKGDVITGISEVEAVADTVVFQAGTALSNDKSIVTAGGRVLAVTAVAGTMSDVRTKVYQGIDSITFEGKQVRRDIGLR